MKYPIKIISFVLLLLTAIPAVSQVNLVVYDGTTGIGHCHMVNDSLVIIDMIEKSQAYMDGIRAYDQILEINGTKVSGNKTTLEQANNLLYDKEGTSISLKIKKRGEHESKIYNFIRGPYSDRLANSGFTYLPDPNRRLSIEDILTDSVNDLFEHYTQTATRVFSVKEGSPADKIGILPGDQITSLVEEASNHVFITIDNADAHAYTNDILLKIQDEHDTSLVKETPATTSVLKGVSSSFTNDMDGGSIWIKMHTIGRITKDNTYLLSMEALIDSIFLYEIKSTGEIIERKAGNAIKIKQRDYAYKDWNPIRMDIEMNQEQVFYIRLVSEESIYSLQLNIVPLRAVSSYDRTERMFLSIFLGMMLIIALYYLIMFLSSKQRSSLWYSLFIFAFGISMFTDEGYIIEISRLGTSSIYGTFQYLMWTLPPLIFLVFGLHYLEIKSKLKLWYLGALILLFFGIGLDIFFIFFDQIEGFAASTFIFFLEDVKYFIAVYLAYLFLIIPSIIRIWHGFKPSWFFLVASIILVASQLYYEMTWSPFNMHNFGIPEVLMLINNTGPYLGAILTFLIFSIGIVQKMKISEKEKQHAQERLIVQLKENESLKDKVNRELEEKVKKRTEKINDQKEEIESQLEEIETQRDELMDQRDMVTAQKEEITDSINYAKRIQNAVLPDDEYLDKVMPEYFVLFKPRDIVSGDFYWIREIKNFLVVVAADCTGHGVPGAFMSMLGISFLNEQIGKSRFDMPGEILDRIRKKVKQTLAQTGESQEQKDGMDMAIAIIDKESKELQFAGAFNPLYLIRKNMTEDKNLRKYSSLEDKGMQLFELKGDRQPIGVYYKETEFSTTIIQLQKDDTIYLFSDGYADQMGGPRGKKYMSRTFKKSLINIQGLKMPEQKQMLDKTLEDWRNGYEQVDDILVMGIRI